MPPMAQVMPLMPKALPRSFGGKDLRDDRRAVDHHEGRARALDQPERMSCGSVCEKAAEGGADGEDHEAEVVDPDRPNMSAIRPKVRRRTVLMRM